MFILRWKVGLYVLRLVYLLVVVWCDVLLIDSCWTLLFYCFICCWFVWFDIGSLCWWIVLFLLLCLGELFVSSGELVDIVLVVGV